MTSAEVRCPQCSGLLVFVIALTDPRQEQLLAGHILVVNWCANQDCELRLVAYGAPFAAIEKHDHKRWVQDHRWEARGLAIGDSPDEPVGRSKLGGYPLLCATELADNEQHIATIWGGDLSRLCKAFPYYCDLMITRTDEALGCSLHW